MSTHWSNRCYVLWLLSGEEELAPLRILRGGGNGGFFPRAASESFRASYVRKNARGLVMRTRQPCQANRERVGNNEGAWIARQRVGSFPHLRLVATAAYSSADEAEVIFCYSINTKRSPPRPPCVRPSATYLPGPFTWFYLIILCAFTLKRKYCNYIQPSDLPHITRRRSVVWNKCKVGDTFKSNTCL